MDFNWVFKWKELFMHYKYKISDMATSVDRQWTSRGFRGLPWGGGSSGSMENSTSEKIPFLYHSDHSE